MATYRTNEWQKRAARTYGGGDYAYFAEQATFTDHDLSMVGDTLFKFLMIELSDTEGCDSRTEAIRRVHNAQADLYRVGVALLEGGQ